MFAKAVSIATSGGLRSCATALAFLKLFRNSTTAAREGSPPYSLGRLASRHLEGCAPAQPHSPSSNFFVISPRLPGRAALHIR